MVHNPRQVAPPDAGGRLQELLAGLWLRSRGSIEERVRMLRANSGALRIDAGNAGARRAGADVAHKLAGILGTFGLPEGTHSARRIEVLLESGAPLQPGDLEAMEREIAQIEAMIDARSREADGGQA